MSSPLPQEQGLPMATMANKMLPTAPKVQEKTKENKQELLLLCAASAFPARRKKREALRECSQNLEGTLAPPVSGPWTRHPVLIPALGS